MRRQLDLFFDSEALGITMDKKDYIDTLVEMGKKILESNYTTHYQGYKWIKVKHWKEDANSSIEENYHALQEHHIKETLFLIQEVRTLAEELDKSKSFDL